MSRRRGEFEHRTSIFEGAFRAWSHLGGLEPIDLETKPASELDPLTYPLENDPRLAAQKEKRDKKGNNDGNDGDAPEANDHADGDEQNRGKRREYPYEPLPRSGLAHPFVQAILSPWLGPDADQDAIQLGLTTLRTWWQHRRKGESGSAIVALGTEKMRGVVEGYTRHFFNLAHCLIVNDKEQPPRTLQGKMRELEKSRNKKSKKRAREEESAQLASLAFNAGFNQGMPAQGDPGMPQMGALMNGQNNILGPLERLHAAQRRQLAESGGVHSNLPAAAGLGENGPSIDMRGRCVPGKVDLPGLVQQVSSSATQLAHRGITPCDPSELTGLGVGGIGQAVDPSKYGDPNVTPVIIISENGDIQFLMRVDGITCAHCVKIVETVLKGCNGNRSPINGLLDAAADRELNIIVIKIDRTTNARRIAFEAARNLNMVGYTAKAKSINVNDIANGKRNDIDLPSVFSAFDIIPNVNPMIVFNWNLNCSCPDNGVLRQDCPRHTQMSPRIIDAFEKTELMVSEFVAGCGKKYNMPCAAGPHCYCHNNSEQKVQDQFRNNVNQNQQLHQNSSLHQGNNQNAFPGAAGMSYQQPIQDNSHNNDGVLSNVPQMGVGRMPRGSMMSMGGTGRHMSLTSETTFGRAMSGLSALSIDWENMEDFDINVDHSAHINNDIVGNQHNQNNPNNQNNQQSMNTQLNNHNAQLHQNNQLLQDRMLQIKDDAHGMIAAHDGGPFAQAGMHYDMGAGRVARRSSLRKNNPIDPNANMNVSFNI